MAGLRDDTWADAPFDNFKPSEATVLLRSSDGRLFRVYKLILALASEFFKDMLDLPQPPDCAEEPIDVTEQGETLELLLRACYPVVQPDYCNLTDVCEVLAAATKYDMPRVVADMRAHFRRLARPEPLVAWAAAVKRGLEDEAQFAAGQFRTARCRSAGSDPVPDWHPDVAHVSAGAFRRLEQFCAWQPVVFCAPPVPPPCRHPPATVGAHPYMLRGADIVLRSTDGHGFRLHKGMLRELSPEFAALVDSAKGSGAAVPTLSISATGYTLSCLLHLCYPALSKGRRPLSCIHCMYEVLKLAVRYKIERAIARIRSGWDDFSTHDKTTGFMAALVARHMGWNDEVYTAAKNFLGHAVERQSEGVEDYFPALEDVPAVYYRRLCIEIARQVEGHRRARLRL